MQLEKVSLQIQFVFKVLFHILFLTSDWLSGVSAPSLGGEKGWGGRWEHTEQKSGKDLNMVNCLTLQRLLSEGRFASWTIQTAGKAALISVDKGSESQRV